MILFTLCCIFSNSSSTSMYSSSSRFLSTSLPGDYRSGDTCSLIFFACIKVGDPLLFWAFYLTLVGDDSYRYCSTVDLFFTSRLVTLILGFARTRVDLFLGFIVPNADVFLDVACYSYFIEDFPSVFPNMLSSSLSLIGMSGDIFESFVRVGLNISNSCLLRS